MADNSDKLRQLRAKTTMTMEDFANKEDFYDYAKDHYVEPISAKEAFKEVEENLLPIFKVAEELCKDLSEDENYFHRDWEKDQMFVHLYSDDLPGDHGDRPVDKLYHMALVSRMIKTVYEKSGTPEEKAKSIKMSNMNRLWIKNSDNFRRGEGLLWLEENEGFERVMRQSKINFNYDDCYLNEYYAAFQRDTVRNERDKKCCSLSGNVLDWNEMKNSNVLLLAVQPFINKEMIRLYENEGNKYTGFYNSDGVGNFYNQAEQNIKNKIDTFCDKKNKENQQQIQKSMEANSPLLNR